MHLDTADTSSTDPLPGDDAPDQGIDAPDMQLFVFALFFRLPLYFVDVRHLSSECVDTHWRKTKRLVDGLLYGSAFFHDLLV